MRARFLFIGTLPLCLVSGIDCAQAQTASGDSEVLPAIEVTAANDVSQTSGQTSPRQDCASRPPGTCAGSLSTRPRRRRSAGTGMDVDKVPASVNAVGAAQIARTDSLNIADALQQYVPGLIISDTTGNPFQPDIQFRGFVASPVAGTPQGLAVYQNGMRINEAFGDTVNWDLIPTAAIKSVTVVTNNPAFGLNALGGAVNVLMKNGFNYQGAEINTMGGSFGRVQSSAQWGKQIDNFVGLWRARRTARQRISQFFGIGRSAASMAMSATGPTAANSISTWASPITISARRRRCRSNCSRTIGGRPTRRRRPRTTALAMPI